MPPREKFSHHRRTAEYFERNRFRVLCQNAQHTDDECKELLDLFNLMHPYSINRLVSEGRLATLFSVNKRYVIRSDEQVDVVKFFGEKGCLILGKKMLKNSSTQRLFFLQTQRALVIKLLREYHARKNVRERSMVATSTSRIQSLKLDIYVQAHFYELLRSPFLKNRKKELHQKLENYCKQHVSFEEKSGETVFSFEGLDTHKEEIKNFIEDFIHRKHRNRRIE